MDRPLLSRGEEIERRSTGQRDRAVRSILVGLALLSWPGHPSASPAGSGLPTQERLLILLDGGRATVDVEDAALPEILREFARRAGIKVLLEGSRSEKISARFDSVPLDEALRRLIKENFVLLYSSEPEPHVAEVWVGDNRTRFHAGPFGEPALQEAGSDGADSGTGKAAERGDLEEQGNRGISRSVPDMDSLLQQLGNGDALQRRRAVWALGDYPDEKARNALTAALLGDDDAEVRRRAAWLLEFTGGRDAISALAEAVSSDRDESVRQRAVATLAKVGGRDAVGALSSALRDPSPLVRYEALSDLHDIGGDQARASVIRALRDPDELVREKAAELLQAPGGNQP